MQLLIRNQIQQLDARLAPPAPRLAPRAAIPTIGDRVERELTFVCRPGPDVMHARAIQPRPPAISEHMKSLAAIRTTIRRDPLDALALRRNLRPDRVRQGLAGADQ